MDQNLAGSVNRSCVLGKVKQRQSKSELIIIYKYQMSSPYPSFDEPKAYLMIKVLNRSKSRRHVETVTHGTSTAVSVPKSVLSWSYTAVVTMSRLVVYTGPVH